MAGLHTLQKASTVGKKKKNILVRGFITSLKTKKVKETILQDKENYCASNKIFIET